MGGEDDGPDVPESNDGAPKGPRGSEERFRLISETLPVLVYSALPDEHSTNLFISGRVLELTGHTADDFLGDPTLWTRLIHPDDRDRVWKAVEEHRRKRSVLDVEYRLVTRQGELKWIRDRASPLLDEHGNVACINGCMEDTTERRDAEQALRRSEERYRALAEAAHDMIFIIDRDDRVAYINRFGAEQLGSTPEELMGTPRSRLFPSPVSTRQAVSLSKVFEKGEAVYIENLTPFKGGTLWLDSWLVPLKDESGAVTAILGISRDITDRKRAEEALKESEQRYRSLVDGAVAGVATIGPDGRIAFVNEALCRMAGFAEAELLCRPFAEFLHPDDRQRVHDIFLNAPAAPRDGVPLEFRLVRKDGSVGHFYSSPTTVRRDGQIVGFSAILQDITGLRQAELARRESERFLENVISSIQDGVSVLDQELRILRVNPTMERWYAHALPLVGKKCYEAYHGRREPCEVCPTLRTLRSDSVEMEVIPKRGPGWEVSGWLEVYSFPLRHPGSSRTRGVIEYVRDITEERQAEVSLRESEEKYRTLFQRSPEAVVLVDLEGRVLDINEAGLKLRNRRREDIVGRRFDELGALHEDDLPVYHELFRSMLAGETVQPVGVRLRTASGDRWQEVFPALLEKDGRPRGLQVILRDVTDRKLAQREMMARLMTYDLQEGQLYLAKEASPVLSLEAFRDLLKAGYRGILLTRNPSRKVRELEGLAFEHRWLSEKGTEQSLPPDLGRLEEWLSRLPRSQALMMDRLDYLLSKNGFERVLGFVHRLRELAHMRGHSVILSLDTSTVGEKELRALEKEAQEIVPRVRPHLPPDLLDLLKHVYQQNAVGARPTLTEVSEELGLSKPTTRKRTNNLVRSGYIVMSLRGRTKVVELTEKGRRVFLK